MAARKGKAPVEERARTELRRIRENVAGVHGSLAATSDGLLVAHDLPGLEPTQIAALVATTLALGSRVTLATGRGEFRETVTRGSDGYLAVYAAGSTAIVAVVGTTGMNVAMLHYQVREVIERIAEYSASFARWASPIRAGTTNRAEARQPESRQPEARQPEARQDGAPPLPARRRTSSASSARPGPG